MRAAAVRLREPGTVKAPAITGNGMAFARLPSKKGAMKHTDRTGAEQTAARQPEPTQEITVTQVTPRRHSQRRRPDHTCNRGRDAHRTAAGTGRGDGQPVGRQHGKPGITRQHAGLPRSIRWLPLMQPTRRRPAARRSGRAHGTTGEGLFDRPEGGIRIAGPPIEANGAALLFGLLQTGVLRNVEIAAAERTQSCRSPLKSQP